jgi:hypothetical protein
MPEQNITTPTLITHGALQLPSVEVNSYNLEIKDKDGFLGDRARKSAFREFLEKWRKPLRKGEDPFGDQSTEEIGKKKLDTLLAEGHPDAAGALHGAIEDFAQRLAFVMGRFLKQKALRSTTTALVGRLSIARAGVILKAHIEINLVAIRHDPDEAALIGAAFLRHLGCSRDTMPTWQSISAVPTSELGWSTLTLRARPISQGVSLEGRVMAPRR